jgi:hypothetical protein
MRRAPHADYGAGMSSTTHHNETPVSAAPVIGHDLIAANHNETLVSAAPVIGHDLIAANHNETLVSAAPVIR